MTDNDCQHCGRHTDGTLCARCLTKLVAVLGELPALMRELEVAVTRQDHVEALSTRVYGLQPAWAEIVEVLPAHLRSSASTRFALPSTPWAFNPDAAAILREVRVTLVVWVRELLRSGVHDAGPTEIAEALEPLEGPVHRSFVRINETSNPVSKPAPTACDHPSCREIRLERMLPRPPGACAWLLEHRNEIAQFDQAGDLLTSITWNRNRIEAAIDRREPDVYLGRCDAGDVKVDLDAEVITPTPAECGVELYAHAEDRTIVCPACGWSYSVLLRKAKLLERVYDEHRPIRQVADAVAGLLTDDRGELVACSESTVRNYIDRGRLELRGTDMQGRQLVRVGDVADLVRAKMERDKARRDRRPRKVPA